MQLNLVCILEWEPIEEIAIELVFLNLCYELNERNCFVVLIGDFELVINEEAYRRSLVINALEYLTKII